MKINHPYVIYKGEFNRLWFSINYKIKNHLSIIIIIIADM